MEPIKGTNQRNQSNDVDKWAKDFKTDAKKIEISILKWKPIGDRERKRGKIGKTGKMVERIHE